MKKRRKAEDWLKIPAVVAAVLLPPLGVYLTWRSSWRRRTRLLLTALSVAVMAAAVVAIPVVWGSVDGGIELIGRKPEAEIYGPELPTAMVSGYVAPVTDSVLDRTTEAPVEYVYALENEEFYHTAKCKYTYAVSIPMTVYQAYYAGYKPCERCHPPEYVPGSMD